MRPRPLAPLAAVLLLGLAVPAAAQDAPKPETVIPRAQALQMGGGKFIEAYTEKTKNQSTAGYVEASDVYCRWKGADNAARAAKLPAPLRPHLKIIDDALFSLGRSGYLHSFLSAGGGTMYTMIAAGVAADRADEMGRVVTAMAQTKKAPALRKKADADLAAAAKLLASRKGAPTPEVAPPGPDAAKQYAEWHADATAALARLRKLLPAFPDEAAARVAARARAELTAYDTGE